MRTDGDGEFWNYVIGGVVGAVVGGVVAAINSYDAETKKIDWASVGINAVVGAVSGVIAASGLKTVAQVGFSAVVSGAGNFGEQVICSGINDVNYYDVAAVTLLGGLSSLSGSGMGKITGRKWAKQAKGLTDLASEKASKAIARQSMGKSYSALMRQSARYTSKAVKPTNIYRGVSSVTGSGISGAVGVGYNYIKSLLNW